MAIHNPQNNEKIVKIPENLQAKIDNAINMVNIAEADYARIQKLIQSEKSTLVSLQEQKTSVETQITGLKTDLEAIISLLAKEKLSLTATEQEKTSAKDELKKILEEIESSRNYIVKQKAELDKREASVLAYEDNINVRNLELTKRETEHNAKVEKLRKAMN